MWSVIFVFKNAFDINLLVNLCNIYITRRFS